MPTYHFILIDSAWPMTNSSFVFLNYQGFKKKIFFYLPLVESVDAKPTDTEGQPCN